MPTRREQAVAHGADLLRAGGPRALTSVAVAERMGITQSAVYRHVSSMDELSALATQLIVSELKQSLHDMLPEASVGWDALDDVDRRCRDLIQQVLQHQRSFDVVARWRFDDGPLGVGIRNVVAEGHDLIAALLEERWRTEFSDDTPLGTQELAAIRAHAQAMLDDGQAIALLAFSASLPPLGLDDLAMILAHRVIAGWAAFVIDLNARLGLAFPQIDLTDGIVAQ